MPLGNFMPVAATCTCPCGFHHRDGGAVVGGQGAGEVAARDGRVEVEPEVAHVGAADVVDRHVVAVERGHRRQVGVHDQRVVLHAQHGALMHRRR